ncbi:S8 family serine peptidase [Archangium violaceum]|uniref:S8 family serine peptidase n=1 Tax=Archangium violaceum TaxID=83451 RepID=UPI0037C01EC7
MSKLRKVKERVPGQYVVVLRDDAISGMKALAKEQRDTAVTQVAREMGDKHGAELQHVYAHALVGFSARLSEAAARRLSEDERVAYVAEDAVVWPGGERSTSIRVNTPPQIFNVWGLDRIDQQARPLNAVSQQFARGTGVHAYVLDTGVDEHLDFSGRIRQGFNAVGDGGGTLDCGNAGANVGHGTHVTGILGGDTLGVAPGVTIYPVRVFRCTTAATSNVIAGVDWVAKNHLRPAVANMSLWGAASDALDDAVKGLIKAGVIVVVIAGNDGGLNACNYSPARVPEAITVGATNNLDQVANFSNQGGCVDLFAPGDNIPSARNGTQRDVRTMSGTSMAAPHVSGAVALYLQTHRSAKQAEVQQFLVDNATTGAITGLTAGSPDRLLFTGNINSWLLQTPTALHYTNEAWEYDMADWNSDGRDDLVAILRTGLSNHTEVHVLDGASDFTQYLAQIATVLHPTDANWDFEVADWNHDGAMDLFAIKRDGLSGQTEVHVLDGANSLNSYLGQFVTAFGRIDANWDFEVADWNWDGSYDLVGILRSGGLSNSTELHILDGATGFSSFLLQSPTGLGWVDSQVVLDVADWNLDGSLDLVAVVRNGQSKSTEVHVLSGAEGFSNFILQTGTALHVTNEAWDFKLTYRDEGTLGLLSPNNGLDLVGILRNGGANQRTEVHILNP